MDYKDMTTDKLLKEEERNRKKYNEIEDECAKNGVSWEEFSERAKKEREALYLIDKYKRLRQDAIVEFGKEWKGDTYTIEEFKEMVKNKAITDEDGIGYYATESSKSDVKVMPSDFDENLIREDFSHVIWFSK